mmetsp:Transcript_72835/g.235631  ORF Transcript_72835/g.235631 Transcript_72835/m.235631 type:complete len:457 (-) Transcript_72835:53-1423(-)
MGGDGKGGKGGGKKHGRNHAFKVLCPESLIASILGPRGSTKEQIEAETGCKLIFSNREEYFPGTMFRMLCIYGFEPDSVVPVLEKVVEHIIACGEQEMLNPPASGEADFITKEPGAFIFRAAVSVRMSGAIIGSKGSTVQAIREESEAKVIIDKFQHQGHQMLKLLAQPDGLRLALTRINECCQTEANNDEFAQWASVRNFADEGGSKGKEKGWEKGNKEKNKSKKGKGGKGKGKGGGKAGGKSADQPHGEDAGNERERSPRRGPPAWDEGEQEGWQDAGGGDAYTGAAGNGSAAGAVPGAPGEGLPDVDAGVLQALQATSEEFPEGTLEMDYTLMCELPGQKIPALCGKEGEHIDSFRRSTGARIHFEEPEDGGEGQQRLIVQGPLLRVFKAHALMMKRYHDADLEAEAAASAELPSVQQLQEQLADLQRQLQLVQEAQGGSAGAVAAAGKGKKG